MMNEYLQISGAVLGGIVTLALLALNVLSLFLGRRFYIGSRACRLQFE